MAPSTKGLQHQDYTIAWICALPLERAAAEAMLDEKHPDLPISPQDENTYILGRICAHNVVILCLPSGVYGTTAATALVSQMRFTFQTIRFGLMVGIGGGVTSKETDIRLGDIVVSKPTREFGGVIQYDYGKTVQDGRFARSGILNKPPRVVLTAVSRLQAAHKLGPNKISSFISKAVARSPAFEPLSRYPGESLDVLFESGYEHPESENTCDNCDLIRSVKRTPRGGHDPIIHYGLIASGNQVMKHGRTRDKLAQELGVLCFEMEAAGLMDVIPCLVIRGICDYADSHKNKRWQDYAAAIAAAYAKEVLSVIHAHLVVDEPKIGSSSELYQYQNNNARERKHASSLIVRQSRDEIDNLLLEKISNYDQNKVHRRLFHKRLLGTTQWFLDHPDFKEWLTGNTIPSLWCSGKIGSGKTIVATSVVEELLYRSNEFGVPLVFFYCESEHPESLKGPRILSSFIKQLCQFLKVISRPLRKDIFQDIRRLFKRTQTIPDFEDLEDLFVRLFHYVPNTTYVIDGFDAQGQEDCGKLLKLIQHLFSISSDRRESKCILLSRDQIPGFTDITTLIPGIRHISTSSNVMRDIQTYIETTMTDKTMARKLTSNPSLLDEIKTILLKESSGMFLWVYLQLEILWDTCFTDAQIRSALGRLPKGLEETYRRCAERLVVQDNIAVKVLKWVSFATRPLHIEELKEAVAFTSSDTRWDPEKIPQQDFIAGSCANLVVVDPVDSCVRFAHHSVKQYLERDRGNHIRGYPVSTIQGEMECGKYCLAYLSFSDFNLQLTKHKNEEVTVSLPSPATLMNGVFRSSFIAPFIRVPRSQQAFVPVRIPNVGPTGASYQAKYKFLSYAVSSWALHTKHITTTSSSWERFEQLATNFSSTWNFHPWVHGGRSSQSHLHALFGWAVKEQHEPLLSIALKSRKDLLAVCELPLVGENLPALHLASKLGYHSIVETLLGFCRVNVMDVEGYVPLHHAAEKGHSSIIRLILNTKDSVVDMLSKSDSTPLFLAASNGHASAATVLLEYSGRNVKECAEKGPPSLTPLTAAVRKGHRGVVEVLLRNGISPESGKYLGRTPIFIAIEEGHRDVVEVLLQWGADPDHRDVKGSTPLSTAAKHGDERLVEMLLEKCTIHDPKDDAGHTPFFLASKYGHLETMKLLVDYGADCNSKDSKGKTPLSDAIRRNDMATIGTLLDLGVDLRNVSNFPELSESAQGRLLGGLLRDISLRY
ncbi:hypothetical protein AJ78_05849 [Emergomyces pasteurianus Ep9510]|uniref:Uncharacterized protein n=1 Tax=Emergomyces pasteurianus Ep9510 TaxID=1447872 RepID=A0A1J9QEV2_9EURO|nr:hypothetical protein AJ78_05849 [Emergomyces pasteurianus Ep9510]